MTRVERQILWLPVFAGIILGVNGIIGGTVTGSQTVLLDGLFSFTYVIVGLLTVWAGHLVTTPSDRYPMGRSGVEPLINILKSLLLVVVVAYTIIEGVTIVLAGGKTISYGTAVVFTLISAAITLAATLFSWLRGKKDPTPLVRGDVINWLVDAAAIIGVAVSLGVAAILSAAGNDTAAGYIDPILAITLGVFTVYLPVKLGVTSLLELTRRTVTGADNAQVQGTVDRVLNTPGVRGHDVDVYRLGRELHVDVRVAPAAGVTAVDVVQWRTSLHTAFDELETRVRFTLTPVSGASS